MREKTLGLLAKVLPHMFARWRLTGDFEILADLPDGEIHIDALSGKARHAEAGPIDLAIAREMRIGLESQLLQKGIAIGELSEAIITVRVDTSRIRTDRSRIVHFDFAISSRIRAGSEEYAASQEEDHVWHSRPETQERERREQRPDVPGGPPGRD